MTIVQGLKIDTSYRGPVAYERAQTAGRETVSDSCGHTGRPGQCARFFLFIQVRNNIYMIKIYLLVKAADRFIEYLKFLCNPESGGKKWWV